MFLCWIVSPETIHDFSYEMTIGGIFVVLTLVGKLLADFEEVGETCSSASMLQFMFSEVVSIASTGNRGLIGFVRRNATYLVLLFLAFCLGLWSCCVVGMVSISCSSSFSVCVLNFHALDALFWLPASANALFPRIPTNPLK